MFECPNNYTTDNEAFTSMLPNTGNGRKTKHDITVCKVYKKRWLILLIFVMYAACSLLQWIEYSIIADVIVRYYGVSYTAADWSSMIYLLIYVVFSIPGFYLLDKLDLRVVILIGIIGTCIGAWVKLASIASNRYWVLLLGQGIVAIFQVLILPVPPKIAAIWFGSKEVSTACSLAVLGCQLGIAIGFLVPPMVVKTIDTQKTIEQELYVLALGTAVLCSIVFLLVLAFFKPEPPTPPSHAQLQILEDKRNSIDFIQSIKRLFLNRSYMLLLVSYSINVGVYYAISTLLNQIILKHYPNAAEDAGRMGFLMTITSMVGAVACGAILDKFNRFKETTLTTYAIALVGTLALAFALNKGIEIVYLISVILGFSLSGVLMIGLQLAAELTYPEPDGTSAGLLTAASQVFGIIFTYLYSFLLNSVGDVWANLAMSAFLFIGLALTACIRFDLRRQTAQISS